MQNKTLNDIRHSFLDFFEKNDHQICSSSPLVLANDPTLMFANAGMNQFKNVFTGAETLPYLRATSAQKCVRAGGKHNDLDNVGYTARHHTFFEMMGNFSFGDYFKEDAILYGWEYLTKTLGLPAEKLLVTVYHDDDEAFNIWKKITGFADDKIIRIATSDNFWSMGDTGPCGPCSEIFYDHGEHITGGPPGSPEEDGDRFIEIWNLVFMQYEQLADGSRVNLPKPSIDTGMGLERMTAIIQGVHNNYEIDLFEKMIAASKAIVPMQHKEQIVSHRVIADHMRSSAFLIADGVLPSNEGRGYVLRRIMRRAMRHAHMLGAKEPLMYQLVPTLIELMGEQYPELGRARPVIIENLRSEEERFKQTLERGLKLLDEATDSMSKDEALSGAIAFKLYDTYGFPLDLTQDILRSRQMRVNTDEFDACMEGQKIKARQAWKGSGGDTVGEVWFALKETLGETEFIGYEQNACDAEVLAIVKDGASTPSAHAGDEVQIILNRTPFYGESGGQVGDVGELLTIGGVLLAKVTDTQKPLENFHVHSATLQADLAIGDKIEAKINTQNRDAIRRNHSATHLLHKALRDALGEHVTQKGSLVDADRLRFDFSHGKGLTAEEIKQIEIEVNGVIARERHVVCKTMAPDDAVAAGALALFGEKYGAEVRVLTMGSYADDRAYSVELCGGTHVHNTADIQAFKIISEGSVAAGIRRIEAVTGENVRAYVLDSLNKQFNKLKQATANYKEYGSLDDVDVPDFNATEFQTIALNGLNEAYENLLARIQQTLELLQDLTKKQQKKLAEAQKNEALAAAEDVTIETIGSHHFAAKHIDGISPKDLRPLAEKLLSKADPGVVLASTENEGKVAVVLAVSAGLTAQYNAAELIKPVIEILGGKGGGGRPEIAQGGGTDRSKLDEATNALRLRISA